MAKRSDFAQKLLDDLRLRKERLAATESSNRTNNTTVADAYSYAKKNYRGSRDFKTTETTGLRPGTPQNRYKGGNKFTTGEASQQVVPFGRGQSTGKIGDLSMALAFALENGGKLSMMDSSGNNSILAFLNQIGGRSLDYEKMGRRNSIDRHQSSTSHFPSLSHLHLKEISRGAQKLNQILTACSNGLKFDRYSMEIGNELLKGATDLEESLRMLLNLQDASEYMSTPRRKSRITLLEEDEDEDDDAVNLAEQKQLARPQFSFDKPSRNYHGTQDVARNDLKLRLAALTYRSEATNFIYEKQSAPHRQSVKSSSNVKTPASFSEQKNYSSSSQSKMDKARIPNVIAKLMGLDELPENVESKHTIQKDSNLLKKTVQGSTKKAKKRTEDAENLIHLTSKQKMIKTNNIPAVQNSVASQGEIELAAHNAGFQVVIHGGKSPWKDFEGTKPATGFEKASIKVDNHQGNITPLNHNIGNQKDNHEKQREHRGAEKSKMKEPVLKDELQRMPPQTHKRSEATVMSEDKTGLKEGALRRESVYTNKLVAGTRQKSQTNLGYQQPHMLRKSEPLEEKQQAEERGQQSVKQKLPARKQKGSESMSPALSKSMHAEINLQKKQSHINHAAVSKKNFTEAPDAMQSEGFSDGRRQEDLVSNKSSASLNVNTRGPVSGNSNQDTSSRDQESKLAKSKAAVPPIMEKKPVHDPGTWNTESIKVHRRETPRMINEVMVRRGGALQNSARAQKRKNSILQEVKQRKNDKLSVPREANQTRIGKSKEPEVSIIKTRKLVASIEPTAVAQQQEREAQEAPTLHSPTEHGSQSAKETQTLVRNDSCQQTDSTVMSDQQGGEPLLNGGVEQKSHITESNPPNGKHQGSTDIAYPSQLVYQKSSRTETARPLTESEIHLKQILIKSQIFLNTAEALFKLNIPFDILDAGGPDCQDEDSKLVLDCGYEIMKRKGRTQELSVHPFIKVSISAVKIRSLDDLVRQLTKDFEKLKFYGGNVNSEVILEEFLPKLLENDVYNKEPDVNCIWDLSWNEMMFAFIEKDDVIRDVERFVLSGLVDEITRDLLQFQIPAF
ncbi:hypothetical protein Pint_08943 [Pistacia integerrima]|uniref:Uncharacterized protein n=1 Tax=Pistacia integerrima TaxID=434235 RepID=A0ACC0XUX8_9ROSI|nr:hypothetical protein Pint_08943 [Pistacia integerrima]